MRALFVNSGILGLRALHTFLHDRLPAQDRIEWELLLLTEHQAFSDRVIRRLLTQRLWRDGWLGLANVDLARFRYEMNAGLHARRHIARAGIERFDVIHFHRQAAAWGSIDVMQRVPSVVSIDCTQDCVIADAPTTIERRSYELNARVDGAVFDAAAAIVSTSHWAVNCLRARYPACATPAVVLASPVMLEHFDESWIDERAARASAGARPRALFVGGDFPRKGGYDLLDAWERAGLFREADLDIVTDWAMNSPLPPGVTVSRGVTAYSAEWRERWRAADLFVMPTRNEAFGLVFQEAGAAGLPVVATAHNAIPEIVRDGESGLLVPPGDRNALIRALQSLIRDPEMRRMYGSRGRDFIARTANPELYLDRLLTILEHAAKRPNTLR